VVQSSDVIAINQGKAPCCSAEAQPSATCAVPTVTTILYCRQAGRIFAPNFFRFCSNEDLLIFFLSSAADPLGIQGRTRQRH